MTKAELWQHLQQHDLVTGDMPISNNHTPWYVRTMLGIAGWIGALFLLGFIGAAFEQIIDSVLASLIVGSLLCALAFFIFYQFSHNDFASQLGLAFSLSGQGLIMVGIFEAFDDHIVIICFIIFACQSLLAVLLPNTIHSVLTSCSAMLFLAFSLFQLQLHSFSIGITALIFALIWSNETVWALHGKRWRPIGYGLCLALLHLQTSNLFITELHELWSTKFSELSVYNPLISTLLVTLTFLWVVKTLLIRENIARNSRIGNITLLAALLLGVLSCFAQGMTTALLILLLGFANGNRVLMGLGLMALLGFMSHYYYQLSMTLLAKSIVLAISGMMLLMVSWLLKNYLPVKE